MAGAASSHINPLSVPHSSQETWNNWLRPTETGKRGCQGLGSAVWAFVLSGAMLAAGPEARDCKPFSLALRVGSVLS